MTAVATIYRHIHSKSCLDDGIYPCETIRALDTYVLEWLYIALTLFVACMLVKMFFQQIAEAMLLYVFLPILTLIFQSFVGATMLIWRILKFRSMESPGKYSAESLILIGVGFLIIGIICFYTDSDYKALKVPIHAHVWNLIAICFVAQVLIELPVPGPSLCFLGIDPTATFFGFFSDDPWLVAYASEVLFTTAMYALVLLLIELIHYF